jgi:hypothetical protein
LCEAVAPNLFDNVAMPNDETLGRSLQHGVEGLTEASNSGTCSPNWASWILSSGQRAGIRSIAVGKALKHLTHRNTVSVGLTRFRAHGCKRRAASVRELRKTKTR